MANHWQLTASLVVSKATGRLPSSLAGPADEPVAAVVGPGTARRFGRNPNDLINTDGRLIHDRPVTAKVQFVYELPKGFLVGLNYTYQQGRPWGRLVQLPEDLVNLPTQLLAEPIDGSRRVASWNILDVRLSKEFKFGKDGAFGLFLDALNLLNDDAHDDVGSRLGTSEAFGQPAFYVLPRRLMLGARLHF